MHQTLLYQTINTNALSLSQQLFSDAETLIWKTLNRYIDRIATAAAAIMRRLQSHSFAQSRQPSICIAPRRSVAAVAAVYAFFVNEPRAAPRAATSSKIQKPAWVPDSWLSDANGVCNWAVDRAYSDRIVAAARAWGDEVCAQAGAPFLSLSPHPILLLILIVRRRACSLCTASPRLNSKW